jgi:hypothetical protein
MMRMTTHKSVLLPKLAGDIIGGAFVAGVVENFTGAVKLCYFTARPCPTIIMAV